LNRVQNHRTESCPFDDYLLSLAIAWREKKLDVDAGNLKDFLQIMTTKDTFGMPRMVNILYDLLN